MYVSYPQRSAGMCGARGMGQDDSDSTPLPPLAAPTVNPFANLFATTDISTWGVGEWVAIAGVALLVWNVIGGISSAGGKVKRSYRKRRKRSQQRQALLSQLESL